MKTILLADGEENLRALLRTTMEDSGYRILEAEDGDCAMRPARQQLPAPVIVDWTMPGMTGLEVTRRLRADRAAALGAARNREEGVAARANASLAKPSSPLELLDTVDGLVKTA